MSQQLSYITDYIITNMTNLNATDIIFGIRTMAISIVSIALMLSGRKLFLTIDASIQIVASIMTIFFPSFVLNMMLDMPFNESHTMLIRFTGLFFLCAGLFSLTTSDAYDATVALSVALCRMLVSALLIVTIIYECSVTSKKAIHFHQRHLYLNLFAVCSILLASAKQLITNSEFNNYPQYAVRINTAMMSDTMLTILQGCFCLMYTDFTFKIFSDRKPDRLHYQIIREIGCFLIGFGVLSIKACGFLHEDHKRVLFKCKIVLYVGLSGLAYMYSIPSNSMAIISTISAVMVANSLIGYWSFGTAGYPNIKKY